MIDKFKQINRGVSNAVGVILLVGITVILAAVLGSFIFGFSFFEEPVNAGATIDITNSSAEVVWNTNQNGELVEVQVNNNLIETLDSVGSTTTITDLSTGDRITAVGVRKDQSQVLTSATVSNGLETEGEDTIPTQNTNLVKSLPESKDTSSDGWSVFETSNGDISDYTTNSNLQITDSTNTYTQLPLNVQSYYPVDETRVEIDVDSINSGTPTYKIGYDYDASTNSFNGNTLSQGELDEGVNNISINPTYKSTSLTAVVEGGSSVDVVYNSIQFESLVDARTIPVQYPEGNEWSNITGISNEIRSNFGVSEADYTITDSTLIKNSSNNSYQFGEPINVSNTEYIKINTDIESLSGNGTIATKSVTEGKNSLTYDVSSYNIYPLSLISVKEINSLKVEPVSLSEEPIDTTFTITNKETGEVVSNADVTIDGTTKTTDSNGEVTFTIVQGEKDIQLSKEDYPNKTKTILVSSEETSIQYEDNIQRVSSASGLESGLIINDPIQLQNNIDFSEVSQTGFSYNKEFDGNGYSITNFNLSSTDKNTSFVSLGGVWKNTTFEGGIVENNSPEETDDSRLRYTNIFDKNRGTISNITVDGISFKGSENVTGTGGREYISVVGSNEGVIEDTVIKNSSFEGKEEVSSLASLNYDGTIKNITVENTNITNTQDGTAAGLVTTNSYDNGDYNEVIRDITMSDVTISAVSGAGIVNNNNALIENATVSNLQLTANEEAGGIALDNDTDAEINNVSVTGSITGGEDVGGIAGQNHGNITDSVSEATVEGDRNIGGLVGKLYGNVSESASKGNVVVNNASEGVSYRNIGGFAGRLSNDASINQSYSTGDVSVSGTTSDIGGFVGDIGFQDSNISISDSYSTGDVSAGNSYSVGGFIGETRPNNGYSITIENSYSTGTVSGTEDVGGFIGINVSASSSETDSTIIDSYWNTDTSGYTSGYGVNNGNISNLTGLTTSEMTGSSASSNMSGFDYTNTWTTVTGDYPDLQE